MRPEPAARWYLYYTVAETDLPAVRAAVAGCHARWQSRWPGLRLELLRRPGLRQGRVTLMEIYQPPAGPAPDGATLEALDAEVRTGLAAWDCGERHVEVFLPCA